MNLPSKKHLKHLNNSFINKFIKWMEDKVRYKRINVFIISIISLIFGITGIYQINISGSIIEDMPKNLIFLRIFCFLMRSLMV